ncbi:MAG TPA: hypothetical protein VE258_05230, partial [Ktedonobacterales bacterium]|nr:hypothetical protein [Ktedonobacterales bacterium]
MTVQCSLGHENPEGSAFCDECGERLDVASTQAAPAAVAPSPPPAPLAPAVSGVSAEVPKLVVEADNTTF